MYDARRQCKAGAYRLPRWTLVLLVCGHLAGCGSNWEVVRSADPNPFVNQPDYAVAPMAFIDLRVDDKPEQEFVASLTAEQVPKWEEDKRAINELFATMLKETAKGYGINVENSSAPFGLQPKVSSIDTGYYRIPAWSANTVIRMSLTIANRQGTVLDEIRLEDSAAFDIFNPSSGGRLRSVAKKLGVYAAEYLESRVHP